jgi:hypothetical protein
MSVESAFIRDEIRTGTFDDYEYRQYVNQLVFIERWLREGLKSVKNSYYHPIRAYRVAGKVPDGFHILRTEFNRETIRPFDSGSGSEIHRVNSGTETAGRPSRNKISSMTDHPSTTYPDRYEQYPELYHEYPEIAMYISRKIEQHNEA